MTQRFGRNKRRAAREAVAAAQAAAALAETDRQRANASLAQAMSQLKILESDVDHIVTTLIELLSDAHVAVPLAYTREVSCAGRIDRWPVKTRLEPSVRGAEPLTQMAVINVVRLLRLVAEVNRDPQRLGVHIRFRDKNDMGPFPGAGIFVSVEEFRRKGVTPEMVDHLMREVRNRFVEFLGAKSHG